MMVKAEIPAIPTGMLEELGDEKQAFIVWYYEFGGWDRPIDELIEAFGEEYRGEWESEAEFLGEDMSDRDPYFSHHLTGWETYWECYEERGWRAFYSGNSANVFLFAPWGC